MLKGLRIPNPGGPDGFVLPQLGESHPRATFVCAPLTILAQCLQRLGNQSTKRSLLPFHTEPDILFDGIAHQDLFS